MTLHREPRDFSVVLESVDFGQPTHPRTVLGRGGQGIQPGHVIQTLYRGLPERWRVKSISRDPEYGTWCATVLPVPVLTAVTGA